MPIYRGPGGSGDASTDAYASEVAILANRAEAASTEAEASATAAENSATEAEVSATSAASSATDAQTAETGAEAAEALAQKWANEAEDTEVTTGEYSAYHWAQKAEGFFTGVASLDALADVEIGASPETGEIIRYDAVTSKWVNDNPGYISLTSDSYNNTDWDTAFGWGDHSTAGYVETETDPTVGSHIKAITATNITNWNTAFGWGDHSSEGYLTSYTETDPVFSASAASGIVAGDITNWDTAYGWGNHASAGYASADDPAFTGRIEEEVFAVTGTTPALNPQNGTIQTWTLSGNSTPTIAAGFTSGSSMTLMIDDGTGYTITWPTMKWAGGSAPTLATTDYTVVTLWKVGSTLYGAIVGDMS